MLKNIADTIKEFFLTKQNIIEWENSIKNILQKLYEDFPFYNCFIVIPNDQENNIYCFAKEINKCLKDEKLSKAYLNEIFTRYPFLMDKPYTITHYDVDIKDNDEKYDIDNFSELTIISEKTLKGLIVGISCKKTRFDKLDIVELVLSILMMLVSSIQELNSSILDLEKKAGYDYLTGVYNKITFEDLIKKEISFCQRNQENKFVLGILDLDNFKEINDTEGHLVGDAYLKTLANFLKRDLRESDIIARIGGDEFAIILRQCDIYNGTKIVEKIINKFKKIYSKSFSVGLAEYPIHGKDYLEIFKKADDALYLAKKMGKGQIHVFSPDEKIFRHNMAKLNFINNALKHKRVIANFQPIYCNKQTKLELYGYEVLMRFIDNNGDILYAKEYINFLEKTGIIIEAGRIVIEQALYKFKKYNLDTLLFINLSYKELQNSFYIESLIQMIQKYNIDSSKICFELTERSSLANSFLIYNFIKKIKQIGVKIVIDDFTEGFNDIKYLEEFEVDYIKFNKDFIVKLINNEENRLLFDYVKKICNKLNVKIIAEGIENRQMFKNMYQYGIFLLQGYYLGEPQINPVSSEVIKI